MSVILANRTHERTIVCTEKRIALFRNCSGLKLALHPDRLDLWNSPRKPIHLKRSRVFSGYLCYTFATLCFDFLTFDVLTGRRHKRFSRDTVTLSHSCVLQSHQQASIRRQCWRMQTYTCATACQGILVRACVNARKCTCACTHARTYMRDMRTRACRRCAAYKVHD